MSFSDPVCSELPPGYSRTSKALHLNSYRVVTSDNFTHSDAVAKCQQDPSGAELATFNSLEEAEEIVALPGTLN